MNTIKADVDAARAAAALVREARERAAALKDATMQFLEKDAWEQYKTAERYLEEAEQVVQGALTAYAEVSNRRHAVAKATIPHVKASARAALARDTAECAYKQANRDVNIVQQLVSEVTRNCKDACRHLR